MQDTRNACLQGLTCHNTGNSVSIPPLPECPLYNTDLLRYVNTMRRGFFPPFFPSFFGRICEALQMQRLQLANVSITAESGRQKTLVQLLFWNESRRPPNAMTST